MKARYLIKGKYVFFWSESLLPVFYRLCFAVMLAFPVMTALYSPEELFGETDIRAVIAVNVFLILCGLFFLIVSYTRKLYLNAKLYSLLEENSTPPGRYFNFSFTFRYMGSRLIIFAKKALNIMLFFIPFVLISFVTVIGLKANGEMIKSIFLTLLILDICLFFVGAVFSFTVNGRYFICDYLFYLNPRMPVRSITKTAQSLCRGKLISLAFYRIRLLPWRLLSVFPVTFPFSSVFIKACYAYIARELYSDRKFYRRLSRMLSGENDTAAKNYTHKNREADTGKLPRLYT